MPRKCRNWKVFNFPHVVQGRFAIDVADALIKDNGGILGVARTKAQQNYFASFSRRDVIFFGVHKSFLDIKDQSVFLDTKDQSDFFGTQKTKVIFFWTPKSFFWDTKFFFRDTKNCS